MSWIWLHRVVGSHCQRAAASCSQRKYCTAVKRKKGKKNLLVRVLALPEVCSMVRGWRRAWRTGPVSYLLIPNNEASLRREREKFRIQFLQCGTKNVLCGYVTVQYNYSLWQTVAKAHRETCTVHNRLLLVNLGRVTESLIVDVFEPQLHHSLLVKLLKQDRFL